MKKTIISILTILCLLTFLLPMAVFAAPAGEAKAQKAPVVYQLSDNGTAEVNYIERTWNGSKVVETAKTVTATVVTADSTVWTNGFYVVTADVTVTSRITVTGNVSLILADDKTLTGKNGIEVDEGNTLKIYGQNKDTGTLTAKASDLFAGIGSRENINCGNIIIAGGTVNADSFLGGAGIGGGKKGKGGNITVNGGIVNAISEHFAAGIGGGLNADAGTVTINGGTVTAKAEHSGAGIGGGEYGRGGTVIINGGTVTAIGEYYGAGIGSCYAAGDTVIINGGNVTSRGGYFGAGIGGGGKGNGGTVTITGGTVTAIGGDKGAGIGSAPEGNCGTVTISGGTVTATGGYYSPGIGNGKDGVGGTVNISGGTVIANGDTWSAGIGGSAWTGGCAVTVTGGKVIATGGFKGTGIGGGNNGGAAINHGTLTIADSLEVVAGSNKNTAKPVAQRSFSAKDPREVYMAIGYPISIGKTEKQIANADALNRLGLFLGTGNGYELDKILTREQGITLIVRMLGAEQEALAGSWHHPFADVSKWAEPYVGYAWEHHLTFGISADKFGGTLSMTDRMFYTLCLRALGYVDKGAEADFAYNDVWDFARKVGLITTTSKDDSFLRGEAVEVLWTLLQLPMKNSDATLADKLKEKGTFTSEA